MHKQVFLDYASTTPVHDEVYQTYMKLVKECYVNSEAVYQAGVDVHKLIEMSREQIAKLLHVEKDSLIFTSGASEANSFAIKGYALANMHKGKHIISSGMEHSSVLASLKQLETYFGFAVTLLPVGKDGRVSLLDLQQALRTDTILVSMMAVNNELGSVQDIQAIANILQTHKKVKLHVDAVQSVGKITFPFHLADMVSVSAHKLYGVKGSGLLYRKPNLTMLPLINGGQQEYAMRGGTMNAPACIVFAKTLRLALENQVAHNDYIRGLSQYLRAQLMEMEDIHINSPKDGVVNIVNFSCISISSEIMMNALNSKGICVSAQSTCSSRTKAPSHTLAAMGFQDDITYGSIRVSMSHLNTMAEIEYFVKSVKEIIHEFRTK